MLRSLREKDQALYDIVKAELARQRKGIELIASESYVSEAIMELQGSVLTNKTAEGYPGKRYHAGCHVVDKMETLGIERAKELFGAEHANIQAHSGSQANQAVYSAILDPGDTILGMRLDQGGHLTHGSGVNFSGKMYNCISYGLDRETEIIDYDEVERLAKEKRPKLLIAGASAYPRLIDYERMSEIAREVGAYFMVDMAHIAGLVAAKVIPSPVPHADFVTSTTTKTLAGARGGFILCRAEYASKVDKGIFPGVQGSMHFHVMGAKAHTFKNAMTSEYRECMQQVVKNAQKLAQELSQRGFRIVTGGTDNHLMLVDVRPKGLTGVQLDEALESVGITVNKNMIPFDSEKPTVTSGVRIGTTAMTIKGMKEAQAEQIAALIDEVACNIGDKTALEGIARKVTELGSSFPLYQGYFE